MRVAAAVALLALTPPAAGPGPRHLIYLHGRIVQDQQSARPRHPDWGYYELEQILATFRERGFTVTGELRPKDATLDAWAERVAGQVRELRAGGVPLSHVTIVGGSMGAAIAFRAAIRLQEPGLHVAVLGACMSLSVPHVVQEYGRAPVGRFLTVRETSDTTSGPCPPWRDDEVRYPSLSAREIVLSTGQDHGFLYRPLPEWVEPLVEWIALR